MTSRPECGLHAGSEDAQIDLPIDLADSDVVVLRVEPQNYPEVMPKIAKKFTEDKIFVSIAAGITMKYIESHLGSRSRIVRVMPNTPAMVCMGASALCRNSNVSDESFDIAKEIFGSTSLAMHCLLRAPRNDTLDNKKMAGPARLELATPGFENQCSAN